VSSPGDARPYRRAGMRNGQIIRYAVHHAIACFSPRSCTAPQANSPFAIHADELLNNRPLPPHTPQASVRISSYSDPRCESVSPSLSAIHAEQPRSRLLYATASGSVVVVQGSLSPSQILNHRQQRATLDPRCLPALSTLDPYPLPAPACHLQRCSL